VLLTGTTTQHCAFGSGHFRCPARARPCASRGARSRYGAPPTSSRLATSQNFPRASFEAAPAACCSIGPPVVLPPSLPISLPYHPPLAHAGLARSQLHGAATLCARLPLSFLLVSLHRLPHLFPRHGAPQAQCVSASNSGPAPGADAARSLPAALALLLLRCREAARRHAPSSCGPHAARTLARTFAPAGASCRCWHARRRRGAGALQQLPDRLHDLQSLYMQLAGWMGVWPHPAVLCKPGAVGFQAPCRAIALPVGLGVNR
jgi:hypothetical protein